MNAKLPPQGVMNENEISDAVADVAADDVSLSAAGTTDVLSAAKATSCSSHPELWAPFKSLATVQE